jgi:hypothetical protein
MSEHDHSHHSPKKAENKVESGTSLIPAQPENKPAVAPEPVLTPATEPTLKPEPILPQEAVLTPAPENPTSLVSAVDTQEAMASGDLGGSEFVASEQFNQAVLRLDEHNKGQAFMSPEDFDQVVSDLKAERQRLRNLLDDAEDAGVDVSDQDKTAAENAIKNITDTIKLANEYKNKPVAEITSQNERITVLRQVDEVINFILTQHENASPQLKNKLTTNKELVAQMIEKCDKFTFGMTNPDQNVLILAANVAFEQIQVDGIPSSDSEDTNLDLEFDDADENNLTEEKPPTYEPLPLDDEDTSLTTSTESNPSSASPKDARMSFAQRALRNIAARGKKVADRLTGTESPSSSSEVSAYYKNLGIKDINEFLASSFNKNDAQLLVKWLQSGAEDPTKVTDAHLRLQPKDVRDVRIKFRIITDSDNPIKRLQELANNKKVNFEELKAKVIADLSDKLNPPTPASNT